MFNSPKIGDFPRSNKNDLHKTLNETANGIPRSFLQPKITSTPLVRRESVFATPPKPHILSPRRYSLSEIATPPRTNKKDFSKLHTVGPLLASTRYNLNVSTYEDTKSPGLAGRIVQYNEETQRQKDRERPPTHQAKYASPGLFPVVHLFKKKLPSLEQKPRTVTIRIASPEYSRRHSQEYNRKLLEGIIKPNSPNANRHVFASPSGEGHNTSTRSVLEALKEISRKRIHANEEYDLNEDTGKRLRTENFNDIDSNKRLRDESPLFDNSLSPNKSSSKRICMYDEYAASCSSMNFSFKKSDQPVSKRKSISISTFTENPVESKHVKLINAETQTIPSEVDKIRQLKEGTTEQRDETSETVADSDKQVKKKESPVKVFDDAPLERIRKNRLAALMGSLAGKDPVICPKPDYAQTLGENSIDTPDAATQDAAAEVSKVVDKPLVSILSSPKKDSSQKSNKHVHFTIPESTSQPNLTTSPSMSFPITRSSASIISPISSTCEAKSSFSLNNEQKSETPAPPSSPVGLTPSSSETTTAVPIPAFGSGSNSSSATSVVSKESSTSLLSNMSKTDTKVSNFEFKFPASPSTGNIKSVSIVPSTSTIFGSSLVPPVTSAASPPKMGGFKFDLNKPVTTTTSLTSSASVSSTTIANSLPAFSFDTSAQFDANKNKSFGNISSIPSTTVAQSILGTAPGGISFGVKSTPSFPSVTTTTTAPSSNNSFGTTLTNAPSLSSTSTSNLSSMHFKFGAATENKPVASGFGVSSTSGLNFGTTSAPSSASAFGASTTTVANAPVSSVLAFGTSKAPVFSFVTPTTTSNATGFGTAMTSAPPTFGTTITTSSSGFGIPSTGGFGLPSANTSQPPSGFGVNSTPSTLGGFATTTTTGTAPGGFGNSSATPMFGTNKPVAPFGVTTTSAPMPFGTSTNSSPFNKTTTSTFGHTTTQSPFGVPSTAVSFGTANAFGGTTTTSSSVFIGSNSSSGFGKPSGTSNIFGGAINTQASGFGATTSKPLFGEAMSSPFGQSTPATTAPAFGGTTTSAFTFGPKTTASNAFGGSFGTTTTTSTGFGSSVTPAFGSANTFGNGSSTFNSGNAFGGPTTSAFGPNTTTATSQSTGFATSNTTSTFGNTNTGFSTNNKGAIFGNSTAPVYGPSAGPSFGTTVTSTPGFGVQNNVSGFGTNTASSAFAKPQTGFGSPSNSAGFGTGTGFGTTPLPTSGFNSSNPPSAQPPVFNFGGTPAASKPAGVFSFGAPSTSEPPKPSFNFTGGSSAPPAFGNSGTPSFGNAGTPSFGNTGAPSFGTTGVPQFNAPQPAAPGMFSIGSGSSTGRTRTQLRAKRRT